MTHVPAFRLSVNPLPRPARLDGLTRPAMQGMLLAALMLLLTPLLVLPPLLVLLATLPRLLLTPLVMLPRLLLTPLPLPPLLRKKM